MCIYIWIRCARQLICNTPPHNSLTAISQPSHSPRTDAVVSSHDRWIPCQTSCQKRMRTNLSSRISQRVCAYRKWRSVCCVYMSVVRDSYVHIQFVTRLVFIGASSVLADVQWLVTEMCCAYIYFVTYVCVDSS